MSVQFSNNNKLRFLAQQKGSGFWALCFIAVSWSSHARQGYVLWRQKDNVNTVTCSGIAHLRYSELDYIVTEFDLLERGIIASVLNFQVQGQKLTVSPFYFFIILFKNWHCRFRACMESHEKIIFMSFQSFAVIHYICMSTCFLVWLFLKRKKALFCFVCCMFDTATADRQKMGCRSGLFMWISEIGEPAADGDAGLLFAVWELIPCCHLERGNKWH